MKFKQNKKSYIREKIWNLLEKEGIAKGCYGKIPNFKGKEEAALLLSKQDFFKKANCIFSAPDASLSSIRRIILEEKKLLIIALPKMKGFVQLDEVENIQEAVTIKGFFKYGKPLSYQRKIEVFIQGAVAVDKFGNRLGKGSGFGDKEWAYFKKKGLLDDECKVVCLVHDLQVINENISDIMNFYDKKVDCIITPSRVIKT